MMVPMPTGRGSLSATFIFVFKDDTQNMPKFFLLGFTFGLLVLIKQIFIFILIVQIIILGAYFFVKLKIRFMRSLMNALFFLVGILFIILPWISWNVATTHSPELITGTSGWVDMPAAYSKPYLTGKSRYVIREEIFEEYEKDNNVIIQGNVQRALYGKVIFFDRYLQQLLQ